MHTAAQAIILDDLQIPMRRNQISPKHYAPNFHSSSQSSKQIINTKAVEYPEAIQ